MRLLADYKLPDLAATQALANAVAPQLRKGDFIALSGDLGAGKTEFARALLHALGVQGDVPSPTFTLVQNYEAKGLLIFHFDLYRLKSTDELEELGWDDALSSGVTLVEWPEHVAARLPADRLVLQFQFLPGDIRRCAIETKGAWATRL
jgi:tRNA threonylcarbamoyl adenosine modification protein YjeE